MYCIAIDPGPISSGVVEFLDGKLIYAAKSHNGAVKKRLMMHAYDLVIIERVVLRGKAGKNLRDTTEWVGRFDSWSCAHGNGPVMLVTRNKVRGALGCNDDEEVIRLMKKLGYAGLVGDQWQALALMLVGLKIHEEKK